MERSDWVAWTSLNDTLIPAALPLLNHRDDKRLLTGVNHQEVYVSPTGYQYLVGRSLVLCWST